MNRNNLIGTTSLIGSAFLYSLFPVFSRIISFNMPLFFQNWFRALVEIIIIGTILIIIRAWKPIKKEDIFWIFIKNIAGLIGFLGSYYAFIYLPIGIAYFIFYVGSLTFGYFFGYFIFKEKLGFLKILSLVLAFVGLFLIYFKDLNVANWVYGLFALISGFGSSAWGILIKKISPKHHPLQVYLIETFFYFLITFFISLIVKEAWQAPALNTLWFANLGFIIMFIGTGQLMIIGYRYISSQIGSLIMISEVVFGIIIGLIVYKETLSLMTLIGGILIISAMILPQFNYGNKTIREKK